MKGFSRTALTNVGPTESCPAGWFRSERQSSGKAFTLQLRIPQAELVLHVAAVSKMRSGGAPPQDVTVQEFAFGCRWRLVLSSKECDKVMSLQVLVRSPVCAKQQHVMAKCTYLQNGDQPPGRVFLVSSSMNVQRDDAWDIAEAVLGGDTSPGLWAKHLVDGHVCLSVTITIVE